MKIKVQRDYLLTEFTIEASVSEIDEILKSARTKAKMVTIYNNGSVQGINIEQKTQLTESQSTTIRDIIGVESKEI